jgi:hypothetical protein
MAAGLERQLVSRAADVMRRRALAASRGPWRRRTSESGSVFHSGPSASQVNERWGTYVVASVGAHDRGVPSAADAEHIAGWDPLTALAVAGWMDHALDTELDGMRPAEWLAMVAVARAFLREPAAGAVVHAMVGVDPAVTPCCGLALVQLPADALVSVSGRDVSCTGRPGTVEPAPAARGTECCSSCGSQRWVPVSFDQGTTRRKQCVPCGNVWGKVTS